jgi:hypothetical protein
MDLASFSTRSSRKERKIDVLPLFPPIPISIKLSVTTIASKTLEKLDRYLQRA